MLPLSLVTLGLAAICACSKPTVRTVGLEVSLSTPTDKVASVSDLRVVATVKNSGDEDLKILKLGTVLDNEHPTRSFIVSKGGKDVPFTGIMDSVSTDRLSENDWVVISAGKSVIAEHNVSAMYDFSASGPGTFTFDPVSTFQVVGLNDNFETTFDTTHTIVANAHTITITTTEISKREPKLGKRPVICPDHDHNSTIVASVSEAGWLASLAVAYISSRGANDQLYKAYFGSNSNSTIIDNFTRILKADSTKATMYCSDPDKLCSHGGFPAYTTTSTEGIFYCDSFYSQLTLYSLCRGETTVNARKIRGGTTLRMLASVLIPGMVDNRNSCTDSQGLTDSQKISSPDNYECFAAQVVSDAIW